MSQVVEEGGRIEKTRDEQQQQQEEEGNSSSGGGGSSTGPGHQENADEDNGALHCEHLRPFKMNGWRPDPALSEDENYMDMTMVVTRNSLCLQGYMGCVLVDPALLATTPDVRQGIDTRGGVSDDEDDERLRSLRHEHEHRLYGAVIGAATNAPLYTKLDSDVHAEVAALGEASRRGIATDGCTAYITMPPCKRCFAALVVSGARRIVSVRAAADTVLKAAEGRGIEMVDLGREKAGRVQERINRLMNVGATKTDKQLADIANMREMRKEEMRAKKARKRARQEEMKKMHIPKKSKVEENAHR